MNREDEVEVHVMVLLFTIPGSAVDGIAVLIPCSSQVVVKKRCLALNRFVKDSYLILKHQESRRDVLKITLIIYSMLFLYTFT